MVDRFLKQTNKTKYTMKNKLLALFASLGMSGFAFGDIQIGENVTIKGFIDASYQNTNSDAANDSTDVSLDEVEIDFLFNSGPVSARVDLDSGFQNQASDDGHGIEQAHFTYTTDGGLSVTVGRMGTMLGFEREDPSGLYTYSRAYGHPNSPSNFNLGNIDGGEDANSTSRNDGVRFGYSTDAFAVTFSVDQEIDQNLDVADSRLNYEIHVGYTGVENLNVGLGYRNDRSSGTDVDVVNVNAAYTAGKALIAGEYTTWNPETNGEETLDAFMLLLDYDFTDKFGGAVRYSTEDYTTTGNVKTDQTKWTIAPNYQITDNLGTIVEFSSINPDGANNDSTQFAVELTYTF